MLVGMASAPVTTRPASTAGTRTGRGAAWGLAVGVLVVAAAFLVPPLTGVDVVAGRAAPLIGDWALRFGPSSIVAVALVVGSAHPGLRGLVERMPWRRLLLASWVVAAVWMVSLALVDGYAGLGRVLDHGTEYLQSARQVDDVGEMLRVYVSRIPLDAPHHWAVHLAGHPPGAVLLFIGLDRLGLGAWQAAGPVVVAVAATVPAAVAVALARLGARDAARRVLPFLVLGPAAVLMAVSADAAFAATLAWGAAGLAAAGAARGPRRWVLAVVAGLLLGWCVMESYGLVLVALLAVGVLVAIDRSWRERMAVGAVAAVAAAGVALGFAALGFAWWEAFPVLHDRYWVAGDVASRRPAWYWVFGNLGAVVVCAGLAMPAGIGAAWRPVRSVAGAVGRAASPRWERAAAPLLAAAVAMVVVADGSLMSKAEVERIWLPFVPWLLLGVLWLPPRWWRWGLVGQGMLALLLQHLVRTVW